MPASDPRPSDDDRIRAALWFAGRGFGVFPVWSARDNGVCRCPVGPACTSPGKHPITTDGFKSATTDEQRIGTFLAAPSHPNYGLVCPEGIFVLDVDGDGIDHLASLEARHGPLPATLRTRTANGWHIFLRWPDGHPRPLRQLFGYVTRWGTGQHAGYVIGPRSVHPTGVEYAPDDGSFEIATLPEAWATAGVAAEHQHVTVSSGPRLETVHAGGRHEFLRDRARTLRGGGLAGEALFTAVMTLNEQYCDPPKTADEVRRAIGDVETKFEPDPLPGTPEAEERHYAGGDEAGVPPPAEGGDFPEEPHAAAYSGLLGECVMQMAEDTDASLPGLLGSFLAVCGAMVPVVAYSRGTQTSSPFIALVGESATGRKGTAMYRALDAARFVWGADKVNRVLLDGLNSGEALVSALHEMVNSQYSGSRDAIALVFEEEYAAMIASRSRDGSTLDPKLRTAFDGGQLSNRKAQDSRVVNPPYWLPALTAITPVELRRLMKAGETQTGAANRWVYIPVRRRPVIPPDRPPILDADLQQALVEARGEGTPRRLEVDEAVSIRLSEYADFVVTHSAGVALDLVKRYAPIAFRVALIHAAAERSGRVTAQHLERSLALMEYARRGISWVFGQTVGNRDADILLRYLQAEGRMSNRFIARNIIRDPVRRADAIDELMRLGYASVEPVATRGRPRLELVAEGAARPFVTFDLMSRVYTPAGTGGVAGQKPPSERETDGQKSDRSVSEVGQKPARSGQKSQAIVCADYSNHQSHHRRTAAGWVCDQCQQDREGQG